MDGWLMGAGSADLRALRRGMGVESAERRASRQGIVEREQIEGLASQGSGFNTSLLGWLDRHGT